VPRGSGIVEGQTSWGTDLWKGDLAPDYNGSDDATMIWWDPSAPAGTEDETGNPGTGAYRYVDGGKRYLSGQWPDEKVKWFDKEDTVFLYDDRPPEDQLPDYPPPNN
jgi:hypothetical protein